MTLASRFHGFAAALEAAGRAPLNVALMRGAGDDLAAGGDVAALLEGLDLPRGSVPPLRLLGALHYLVLTDRAPALAAFYPTAGGTLPPGDVWPAAREAIAANEELMHERVRRGVQTNEVGRSAVLYPGLLWLTARQDRPIRLLEFGASAGVNLQVDRFAYVHDGATLGDPHSTVVFDEPWSPAPPLDLRELAGRLRIVARAGCDPAPLDPADPEDRLTLLSYVWADERARFERARAALLLAARDPVPIDAAPTPAWLREVAGAPADGALTVVWQSIMRQYVPDDAWAEIESAMDDVQSSGEPVVWLTMEVGDDLPPGDFPTQPMRLRVRTQPDGDWQVLASCGDHGPPVSWSASST